MTASKRSPGRPRKTPVEVKPVEEAEVSPEVVLEPVEPAPPVKPSATPSRFKDVGWWCSHCDHSQTHNFTECQRCRKPRIMP